MSKAKNQDLEVKDAPNEKEYLEGAQASADNQQADNPYAPGSTPHVAYELGYKFGDVAPSSKTKAKAKENLDNGDKPVE